MASSSASAEQSVRSYLLWLDDPDALRDEAAIAKAEAAVDKATDPIDRLKALAKLEALQKVDGATYEAGFVENAKDWAETNDVSASNFAALGVPASVLSAAGFPVRGGRRGGRARSGGRRTRTSPEAVRAAVPAKGQFTVADVIAASGASMATVRKVVGEMVAEGLVVDLGPDQGHSGRGRAPLMYRRA